MSDLQRIVALTIRTPDHMMVGINSHIPILGKFEYMTVLIIGHFKQLIVCIHSLLLPCVCVCVRVRVRVCFGRVETNNENCVTGGVSLTMRLRMECSVITDDSVTTKTDEECLLSPDPTQTTFSLPTKKWDKKQKISTGMLVSERCTVCRKLAT